MKVKHNVSAQTISWVKSNQALLENNASIQHLYYPETMDELLALLQHLTTLHQPVDVIGYASNTLFLPSYNTKHLICTKLLNHWNETDEEIICECGVNVSNLAKIMIQKGYKGFEGLTDLPGTVAASVYGNSGCRNCSINQLLNYVTLLNPDNQIERLTLADLCIKNRSSALKRKEKKGVLLYISLRKIKGNPNDLQRLAQQNHAIRLKEQPSPANNLGTTLICADPTFKGHLFLFMHALFKRFSTNDVAVYRTLFHWFGGRRFASYTYRPLRYLFLDEQSHLVFPDYLRFMKTLYHHTQLEIEIRQ